MRLCYHVFWSILGTDCLASSLHLVSPPVRTTYIRDLQLLVSRTDRKDIYMATISWG